MKLLLKALALAVLTFMVGGQYAAQAQGGPLIPANRVYGSVTAVDTTANTITVQGRGQDATATTVKVTSDTKYTKPVTVALTTINVGDPISVRTATAPAATDTSIAAESVIVLDALPAPGAPGGFGNRGGRGGATTTGTVVTTTPTLTIKTTAGTTLTVTTTDTTTVSAIKPATLADIAVGNNVSIVTKTDTAGNVTATTVAVQPARQRRTPRAGA
jgi:hypothetical protein